MEDWQKVDDIVARLDRFMAQGGGHMNIFVEKDLPPEMDVVLEECQSTDCSAVDMACSVPTIHQGIDDDGKTME